MEHSFSTVPSADIKRSTFNRSFSYRTAIDSGYLVPFYVDEVLPGDTHNLDLGIFARMATPLVPVMDNIYLETFFFFVPNRLVWDNFKKQQGERKNPGDSIDYLTPQLIPPEGGFPLASTADYMGIPPLVSGSPNVNALPFRACNLIYNEYFRDENLIDSLEVRTDDGPDPWIGDQGLVYPLFRRGKRHDYFTSALPWPQKGPGVDLPIGTSAPVYGTGGEIWLYNNSTYGGGKLQSEPGRQHLDYGGTVSGGVDVFSFIPGEVENPALYADLSKASSVTINQLRQAFMYQQLLERDAVGGSRYTEILRSHFSVICPDFRLQRPEYLGGSSGLVNIHQVAQTSSTDSITPQGNLAAYGVYSDTHNGFVKSFTEHGYIIGFVNIRADLSYQQGLERHWSKRTRYDYYLPSLAHLGEQAILSKEIYLGDQSELGSDGEPLNDSVFGYQERYAEYRYKPSLVTGILRSVANSGLDSWHLSQYFAQRPVLNSEFISDNPPIDRVIAVPSEPQFLVDFYCQLNSVRPMPVHGVPGFQSHF